MNPHSAARQASPDTVLLLADVHSNIHALGSVLDDAMGRYEVGAVWVLGDVVGYNAFPNEVVELIRQLPNVSAVKGNHEAAALAEISVTEFNPVAAEAARWTGGALDDENRSYLSELPLTSRRDDVTLCHGSPRSPLWEYVVDAFVAQANLDRLVTRGCVHGHTHLPTCIALTRSSGWQAIRPDDGSRLVLEHRHWFVNPGSVGQPRDGDPRAAYAVLQRSKGDQPWIAHFHRVDYDVSAAQDAVLASGLPPFLAFRLSEGR